MALMAVLLTAGMAACSDDDEPQSYDPSDDAALGYVRDGVKFNIDKAEIDEESYVASDVLRLNFCDEEGQVVNIQLSTSLLNKEIDLSKPLPDEDEIIFSFSTNERRVDDDIKNWDQLELYAGYRAEVKSGKVCVKEIVKYKQYDVYVEFVKDQYEGKSFKAKKVRLQYNGKVDLKGATQENVYNCNGHAYRITGARINGEYLKLYKEFQISFLDDDGISTLAFINIPYSLVNQSINLSNIFHGGEGTSCTIFGKRLDGSTVNWITTNVNDGESFQVKSGTLTIIEIEKGEEYEVNLEFERNEYEGQKFDDKKLMIHYLGKTVIEEE